jgi:hypothetical protein
VGDRVAPVEDRPGRHGVAGSGRCVPAADPAVVPGRGRRRLAAGGRGAGRAADLRRPARGARRRRSAGRRRTEGRPAGDLSDIDPLAPKYDEWKQRAAQIQIAVPPRAETLLFGADRLGRDVLAKAIKGAEVSIFVGLFAAVLATIIGTILGALSGYVGAASAIFSSGSTTSSRRSRTSC